MNDSSTYVIGMDLSDRTADYFAAKRGTGEFWRRGQIELTREGLTEFLADLPRSWVVIETGTHSRWIKEHIEAMGHEVTVADARQLRIIFHGRHKTDALDAKALCDLALLRKSLLCPVALRGEAMQRDLAMIRIRDAAVRARSLLVNNVRGTVKTLGERVRSGSTEYFVRYAHKDLGAELLELMNPMLEAIDALSETIATQDGRIKQLGEAKYPETKVFRKVFGVGPITSLAFVLTLFDRDRFAKNRDVGPFLGLTPAREQSGEVDRRKGISKAGNEDLRRLLTQCAQTILRANAPDSDLRRHGLAIWKRGGKQDKGAKRRAVTAVSRKLAVLMCSLWKTAEVYEPLRNHPAA